MSTTTSLCSTCKRAVPAELWRAGDAVVLRKRCPEHGEAEAAVSSSAAWYEEAMAAAPALDAPVPARPVAQGCPFDCGPCGAHEQRTLLPIIPITGACNLDCPICYTHNRNDAPWHITEDELRAVLGHLRRLDPARRIVNLTGGEPTLHPAFERLVELCQAEGIRRITISTHGLRFLKDEALLERLARLQARIILSFDSLRPGPNEAMLGGRLLDAKLRVLELLEKHGVDTTLLAVVARGQNDGELGALVDLALGKEFVRSVELHTMTFTGQGGARFDRGARLTAHDVLTGLERTTGGTLRVADFVPSPAAHPLCYQLAYLLRLDDGRWLPFTRFMGREDLRAMLAGTLYLEPGAGMERRMREVIDRLWSGDLPCEEPELVLRTLKALVARLFDGGVGDEERLRRAERASKAVYVHAHMDEETFDTDRIRRCCVGVVEPDGRSVPSCSYNVLHRERDARFTSRPAPALVTLGPGLVRR